MRHDIGSGEVVNGSDYVVDIAALIQRESAVKGVSVDIDFGADNHSTVRFNARNLGADIFDGPEVVRAEDMFGYGDSVEAELICTGKNLFYLLAWRMSAQLGMNMKIVIIRHYY